ncbi:MAG: class I SAM-dependent methyltransferase [Spirochaetes bacterium]|nr:class I SAM-dependent methyltransferase [Spirochaetota bacterium]
MLKQQVIDKLLEDAKELYPSRWPEIEKHFQRCCLAISVDSVMWDYGFFQKKGEEETFTSMLEKGHINPDAKYVFQKMLDMMVEENILAADGEKYTCLDPEPDVMSPAEWLVEAVKEIPEEWAAFQWLARGGGGIKRFLRGKFSGEEIMFPWGDFALVGQVYFTSETYCFWSKLAAKAMAEVINNQFDKKIEILEIGAGTGSGTTELFTNLGNPADKFEKYVFTDIHRRLVKKTSKNFTDYQDFMEFKALDVTVPLEEQEVSLASADILYAVNVMHAINDIEKACKTMHDLVADNGYAVLGEIAPPEGKLYRYMELTFGLLASYYQYNDHHLRPQSPLLRPNQWIEYLKKAGFSEAIAIPGDYWEDDRGGVVIARK